MIIFNNLNPAKPYQLLKSKYDEAINSGQKNVEAISISSFNTEINEVDSRFVNLKFIENDEFIFFTNYSSPKAISFKSHNQIAALFYWPNINTQIRMKAIIEKTSNEYNEKYFLGRSKEKNALAISSSQSKPIESYNQVKENYNNSLKNENLKKCPVYWGGYSFIPFEIEFWEGNAFRLNKRNLFEKNKNQWNHSVLQP